MSKIDELRNTFFEECNELLQDIEVGLTEMREGRGTEDTVHAVFRAAHSVKGGAGIFGFETLVEFAHVFETVLDAVRHGNLATTDDVLSVLLTAGDILADLVGMARSGEAVPEGYDSECRTALNRLMGDEGDGSGGGGDDSDFGIDFKPVAIADIDDLGGAPDERVFRIAFRPSTEMLKKANEPLYILRELAGLGRLELEADASALPKLSEIQPDHAYISWTGTLHTTKERADVERVFEFVVSDCELEIIEEMPAPGLDVAPAEVMESCGSGPW
jgi:two-component system, chemotaxis family, sensor kinase CheA